MVMHWTRLILTLGSVLFLLPIIIANIPTKSISSEQEVSTKTNTLPVAYANNGQLPQITQLPTSNVLIYFAHPEEAYKPITEKRVGTSLVSHKQENIQSLAEDIKQQLELQLIETDILQVNVSAELSAKNLKYKDSYEMIRPFVRDAIKEKKYDLVIDIHRDAMNRNITTLMTNQLSYAKVAFVIGSKHANYEDNYALAKQLSTHLNELVPGISRGVIKKGEAGSNGIYNQDLASNLLLIELGGIENTEEELLRTVAVLARAIAEMQQTKKIVLMNE